jgi:hypothetical protein
MSVLKPLCIAVLAAMVSTAAIAVPYVYPAKGQSTGSNVGKAAGIGAAAGAVHGRMKSRRNTQAAQRQQAASAQAAYARAWAACLEGRGYAVK